MFGLLVALAAGALSAFCFGREPLTLAPWVAMVPLFLFLGVRRPGWSGWLFGLGFWLTSISWIPATLSTFGSLPSWLAWGALLLLASYLAVFPALFARLGASVWRAGGWSPLVFLPALWVLLEFSRGFLLTGFPWNLAAYSAIGFPGVLALAAWVGPYGISALVLLVNCAVAQAVASRAVRPMLWVALGALLLLAVGGRAGESAREQGATTTATVTVLQPNIPNMASWDAEQSEENYRKVFALSRQACRPGELLVWPESAAWPYAFDRPGRLRRDVVSLLGSGCTLLFNSPVSDGDQQFNSAFLVSRGLAPSVEPQVERYDKQHLVPFGEYVPLGRWLPFLQQVARAAGSFSPGSSAETAANLNWNGEALATSICFEITFPEEVAAKVAAGATILTTMTNDAWYGDTWAPWQHLRSAQFRAAENRRPLVRAAITGISAVIGADGKIEHYLGVDAEGEIRARISAATRKTPFTRFPLAAPIVAALAVAFVIFRLFLRPAGGS